MRKLKRLSRDEQALLQKWQVHGSPEAAGQALVASIDELEELVAHYQAAVLGAQAAQAEAPGSADSESGAAGESGEAPAST